MSLLSKPYFHDEAAAFAFLEGALWPNGPMCPHCGATDRIYPLQGKTHRMGLKKCGYCREQFTVKVGTVMESSHVPLTKWLQAMHLLCSSKKGISSHQLHRLLNVTYKTAWFMSHRIRQALEAPIAGHGAVQGIIHALYKEADRPYFQLRDLATQELVKCEYPPSMYHDVVSALNHQHTTVHVSGMVKLDRAKRATVEMQVERIEAIAPMAPDEFEMFFGIAPGMTGDMPTEDYIEMIRGGRE